jgi:NAD(P)-dependent dehydrogenase (short-subunit alcohol dehydrogenase family)
LTGGRFRAKVIAMSRRVFDLTGHVALVTGGSKGLGKAMARGFAEAGADVVISSRRAAELEATAAEIRAGTGVRGAHVVANMTRREDVRGLAASAITEMGHVDIPVNNAGSNTPQSIDEILDEDRDRLVERNLNSCRALTRALVGPMKERRWGRIIHISSIRGFTSAPGRNAYSATKSALTGPGRAGANDLGGLGITVNCLPRTVPDGPSRQPIDRRATFNLRPANGPEPPGESRGAGGPGPVAGERGGELHHRRHARRRRRRPRTSLPTSGSCGFTSTDESGIITRR